MKVRSLEELKREWMTLRGTKKKDKSETKSEEKKQKVLLQLEKSLKKAEPEKWLEFGLWLQAQGPAKDWSTISVPDKWSSFILSEESILWNMQNAFEKSKALKQKKQRILQRQKELQEQTGEVKVVKKQKDLFEDHKAKGEKRKFFQIIRFVM